MANFINMPRIGLNEEENLIGEILINEGDEVAVNDELFTVETDKSTFTVTAEQKGAVLKLFYENFDTVKVLTPVCIIGEKEENIENLISEFTELHKADSQIDAGQGEISKGGNTEENSNSVQAASKDDIQDGILRISPRAKRLAKMNGVEYHNISPSGAENRIVEQDILNIMNGSAKFKTVAETKRVKLTRIRKIIAENMMNSLSGMAQLTSHTLFDASQVLDLRESYKQDNKNITIGDIILFGVVKTLIEFPEMNAHLLNEDEMVLFSDVNLGVAVDTERGLMVPTVMGANHLCIEELSNQVKSLALGCREGSISPDKLTAGTFTVSNLGGEGVRYFTPIINPPQVGILGVGNMDYMARKTKRGMEFYPACYLSLTYDHRAIDGAPSARFLKKLCNKLENIKEII